MSMWTQFCILQHKVNSKQLLNRNPLSHWNVLFSHCVSANASILVLAKKSVTSAVK